MAQKRSYFISDLHLGAKYMNDPVERERRVCRFFDSIKDDAAELFLLGDILDYWYEYKYVVPRGYIRRLTLQHLTRILIMPVQSSRKRFVSVMRKWPMLKNGMYSRHARRLWTN